MPRKRKLCSQDEYRMQNNQRRRDRYVAKIVNRQQHGAQIDSKKTTSITLQQTRNVNVADVLPVADPLEDEHHLIDVPIYTATSTATSSLPYQCPYGLFPSSSFVQSASSCFPFSTMPLSHIVDSLSTSAISEIDPCTYSLLSHSIYFFTSFIIHFNST